MIYVIKNKRNLIFSQFLFLLDKTAVYLCTRKSKLNKKMLENKTVKYHIPQNGIYVYVRTNESKTEMIVLNSTDKEQVLPNNHYNILTKDHKEGKDISSGKKVDFTQNLILAAHQSMIIEFGK